MLEQSGFDEIVIGEPVDTFGGAKGEASARTFEVYGYAFLARKRLGKGHTPKEGA